ncbi:MAG: type II secretion system F family protein [Candidatus Omnitrophica bacterium]|nr:type II secretion system F family protein [Candidatus Omnitrophota bacterium]
MPTFNYTAKPAPDKTTTGKIEAESQQDAINKLTVSGLYPISVSPEDFSAESRKFLSFKKVSKKDLVLFTGQLSGLVESGVNIVNALKIISGQSHNKNLKSILNDIISRIKDGNSLSESLSAHKYLFSGLYSAVVRTGEASGNLKSALKGLAVFLEKEEEFRDSLVSSLIYPAFVIFVGTMTVLGLLVFVIPRLVSMFEDMGQALPLPTLILINISSFIRHYWWLIMVVASLVVFLLRRFYESPGVKVSFDKFKLGLTIAGPLILKAQISRMMRTLSLLLSSGIPISASLEVSATVLDNHVLRQEVDKFKEQISRGASLSSALKTSEFFPEFVTNVVSIGEESGSLDKALARIAGEYEKEVDRMLKTLTRMTEPVIILVMGLVVGFIVLAMLLPIFQINLIAR